MEIFEKISAGFERLYAGVIIDSKAAETSRLAKIWETVGDVALVHGNCRRAIGCYLRMLELGKRLCDTAILCKSYAHLGTIALITGEYNTAVTYGFEALKLAEQENHLVELAEANHLAGKVYTAVGQPLDAVEYLNKALHYSMLAGERALSVDVLLSLVESSLSNGRASTANGYLETALRLAKPAKDPLALAKYFLSFGVLEHERKKGEVAINHFLTSLQLSSEIGYRSGISWNLAYLGELLKNSGDIENAAWIFSRTMKHFRYMRETSGLVNVLGLAGECFTRMNRLPVARNCFYEALTASRGVGYRHGEALTLFRLALYYLKKNKDEKACTAANRAIQIFHNLGNSIKETEVFYFISTYLRFPDSMEQNQVAVSDAIDTATGLHADL
jgi:tetratricopeptide (TPR) repeat protein